MIFLMKNEFYHMIEMITHSIQNQEFDQIQNLEMILKSQDFLDFMKEIKITEAEMLYSKIKIAIGIINTQKELLLDELTLLQNAKKSLNFYTP